MINIETVLPILVTLPVIVARPGRLSSFWPKVPLKNRPVIRPAGPWNVTVQTEPSGQDWMACLL